MKGRALSENADDFNNEKLVTVAQRPTEVAASILVAVLADEGIRAVATGGFTAGFRAEAPGWAEVRVLERDAPRAREIIAEVKESAAEDRDSTED